VVQKPQPPVAVAPATAANVKITIVNDLAQQRASQPILRKGSSFATDDDEEIGGSYNFTGRMRADQEDYQVRFNRTGTVPTFPGSSSLFGASAIRTPLFQKSLHAYFLLFFLLLIPVVKSNAIPFPDPLKLQ